MTAHVFIAMSGGVDSAAAALLLKEAGYRVSAVHLELTGDSPAEHSALEQTCRILDIPLHYWRMEEAFRESVIDYFCDEYARGRTPNPCVRCNRSIKFGRLLEQALAMGADFLATGHYAGVEAGGGLFHLLKGQDRSKDQSYFLYVLDQPVLARVLFPLGRLLKSQVKALAAAQALPAAQSKESQDICFVPDNDHQAFLAGRVDSPPGDIVDKYGRVLGRHRGLAFYTIGQRQGLRVSAAERLYVIHKDTRQNRLVIGRRDELLRPELIAGQVNWVSGQTPDFPLKVKARVRFRATEAAAVVSPAGDQVRVVFETPQTGIAPGQSVVFYQGDEVLGGGIIEESV